jgi:hypothetical protein
VAIMWARATQQRSAGYTWRGSHIEQIASDQHYAEAL